jgi:hypothetical protein
VCVCVCVCARVVHVCACDYIEGFCLSFDVVPLDASSLPSDMHAS